MQRNLRTALRRRVSLLLLFPLAVGAAAQTLDECQQAAELNYPLIRQRGLIEKTTGLTVSNLQKAWLPQVSVSAQATLQSDVMSWPDQMQSMLKQMGVNLEGLKKDQYRVGIDVQQTVFDGGATRHGKEVARRQGDVEAAQNEVSLYQVRRRVNELYFGLLLIDEQIRLNRDLQEVLMSNERKLGSMFERGTAAESDYNSVKAERLNVVQQATGLEAQRRALSRMLGAFCGIEVTAPSKPAGSTPPANATVDATNRPELKAIDARLRLADAQQKALDAALMPRLGVFAQGYYGYPGYNMFEDMMNHRWSWNGMIGARLTWNIGALYSRKNDRAKIDVQRAAYGVQRDAFLFDNRQELIRQDEDIERYRRLMASDDEIIALRTSVRRAAESRLAHGIADVSDLVKEINSENAARVQQSVHEIQMLKEIYDRKFTLNE